VRDFDSGENPNTGAATDIGFSQTGQIGIVIVEYSVIWESSAPRPAVETRGELGGGAYRQSGVGGMGTAAGVQ
jgi:hypothetical protein